MAPFILYLLKVNIAFAVLYLFYKVSFTRDTFLGLRRSMLLMIYVAAICYPFIGLPAWLTEAGADSGIYNVYSVLLPEVLVGDEAAGEAASSPWLLLLLAGYFAGVLLLFVRTLTGLYKIHKQIRACKKRVIHGVEVHVLPAAKEPFSFLKWICVYPGIYEESELKEILVHEQTHVQRRHSLDILFAQLVIVFCWFNPFVWLIRSEMRINHEYEADKKVVRSGFNKKQYQYHLVGFKRPPTLAAANLYNNFSVLPLKNRIKMLNRKETSRIMRSKYLIFLPVLALLVFFSNCQNEAAPKEAEQIKYVPEEVTTRELTAEEAIDEAKSKDGVVFEVVEKMPEFPGGNAKLMEFLRDNIKYPEEAVEKGTQGRVIVQFVVNEDGVVTDPVVARSIDELLDEEAIRVIGLMPNWIPGQQKGQNVRVRYTVPVSFRLQ